MYMNQFLKDRREALLSMDKKKIEQYMKKYDVRFKPSNDLVFWTAIHKARCNLLDFPIEEKEKSRKWLHEHGFSERIN